MNTMKAIRIHDYGGPEEIRLDTIARPIAQSGEVLVRVHAASVNPVDWKVRDGVLRERLPMPLPFTPGGDFSGTVEAVGSEVSGFGPGDSVYGMTSTRGYRAGAFAEFVAVRAEDIAPKPLSLDHAGAGSVPLAALTAWQALFDRADLRPGQSVLIQAGAGGVGSFAVQFACHAGANVVATTSAANMDYVRELGAAQVIDYRSVRFETAVSDIDVVVDLIGGEVQERSYDVLKPGGVLVNAWGAILQEKADAAGVRGVKVAVEPNAAQLRQIAGLIDAGTIRISVAAQFPLAEAGTAMELSKSGHVRGKIVLIVA